MAKPQPSRLSVRRDQQLDNDLATVMRTGMTQTQAVRHALAFLAHGYRHAWAAGLYPEGTEPPSMAIKYPPSHAPDQRV